MKNIQPEKDLWGEPLDEKEEMWFWSFCTPDEIKRVLQPNSSKDYLLRLRAEYIADHARLTRVFIHLRRAFGNNWSLEKFFSSNAYEQFKSIINSENKEKCEGVECGSIYDNNAEGLIFSSPYGMFSTYSKTLYYFSIYSNLALGEFQHEIPMRVRMNAMRIACRIMLNKESEDFIVDPRGIIPKDIQEVLDYEWAIENVYIAGHELSHFILGHIKEENKMTMGLLKPHFKDDTDYRKINGYRISQLQEFEADLAALNLVDLDDENYSNYYEAALSWFASLAVYEGVEDCIFPPSGWNQTHPGAIARYTKILDETRRPKNFDEKLFVERLPELVNFWRNQMIEDVSTHIDFYEMYGSAYLDAPNTEWRGRELKDRVDY